MSVSRVLPVLICLLLGAVVQAADPPAPSVRVRQIKVLPDKAPDCSSLKTIVDSVTRGCRTNDEKAIALYNFMQLTHYHQNYPSEKEGLGALKEINVYGWSLCGGLHTVEAALWREMGWKWRYVGWSNPGHTTVEAQYDGRWHYLDVFLRYYAWMPDPNAPGGRTIAGQDDIKANPALITDGLEFDRIRGVYYHKGNRFEVIDGKANWLAPSFLSCGDTPDGIVSGVRGSNRAGSPTGWATLNFDSPGYTTDVDLTPGASLTLTWDAVPGASWWNGRKDVPGHGCGDKDYRNCPSIGPILEPYNRSGGQRRSYANGTLRFAPDLSSDALFQGLAARDNVRRVGDHLVPIDPRRPASITVALQSPYVMTRATGLADGADRAEVSVDGGKTWQEVRLADFSETVGGQYACLVRLSFKEALAKLDVQTIVQCNRTALPYLSPGPNKVTVTVADPKELGDNRLVVTYAYQPGSRDRSYEQLAEDDNEVARAHHATWADKPTVVQKIFTARDLPATFDIDVPTPAGQFPVYPRMLFLRREVLAPGARPLPLQPGAQTLQPSLQGELKTMSNPFTIGSAPAPPRTVRPTVTRTLTLQVSHFVSRDGHVADNHFLKWKEGETWVLLIGGDVKDLPPARDIVAARLLIPVTRGHAQAATKVGVSVLGAPFQKGKPFDFKDLGEVDGTAVVPRQPGEADYNPPKAFTIDVTRLVKRLSAGGMPFRGLALRVMPDRAVDDGYLTRIDVPGGAEVRLEVDVVERK